MKMKFSFVLLTLEYGYELDFEGDQFRADRIRPLVDLRTKL